MSDRTLFLFPNTNIFIQYYSKEQIYGSIIRG